MVSIFPVWGYPHISETTYVEKERKRGQVCVEPHIFRKVPYRRRVKNAQKNTWGQPQVFLHTLSNFALDLGKAETFTQILTKRISRDIIK